MPTLGLARRLVERGHDARLLGSASIGDRYPSLGWRFRPFQEAPDYDATTPLDVSEELPLKIRTLWCYPAVGRDLRVELAREAADALVVDMMLLGGLSAAIASAIPTIALFHQAYSAFT